MHVFYSLPNVISDTIIPYKPIGHETKNTMSKVTLNRPKSARWDALSRAWIRGKGWTSRWVDDGWWCAFPRIPPTAINSSGGEVARTHTCTHACMAYAQLLYSAWVQVVLLAKGDDRRHIHGASNRRAVHLADTRVPPPIYTWGTCTSLVHVDTHVRRKRVETGKANEWSFALTHVSRAT